MAGAKNITVIPARKRVGNTATADNKPKLKVAAYCRVSTDSEEQATSYDAQVEHYTEFIRKNPEWEFAGIYADDGISGTNTKKREEFNRMIEDTMAGKIDMIITKSISRFARNTLSCLNGGLDLPHRDGIGFGDDEGYGELGGTTIDGLCLPDVGIGPAGVLAGNNFHGVSGFCVGFHINCPP